MAQSSTDREGKAPSHEDIGLSYLWHLEAIGLIDSKSGEPDPCWQVDDDASEPVARVAIIDNGATRSHPNLDESRMTLRADFASWILGAVYEPAPGDRGGDRKDRETFSSSEFIAAVKAYFEALFGGSKDFEIDISKLNETGASLDIPLPIPEAPPIRIPVPVPGPLLLELEDPSYRFAAHGTACAGLVGASARPKNSEAKAKAGKETIFKNPHAIKYTGVDPDAEIIPINTAYSHDYFGLILALLYAREKNASVILFPRAVEEMLDHPCQEDMLRASDPYAKGWTERPPDSTDDPRFTRLMTDPVRSTLKDMFEDLLSEVSNEIPTVVPAGNGGPGTLEYPARLAIGNPPKCPRLIVVGAATAFGKPASYSEPPDPSTSEEAKNMRLIYAPSDDREEVSEETVRFDDLAWRGRKLPTERVAGPDLGFCPYKILAIDIPGPYGYSIMPEDAGDLDEPGSKADGKKTVDRAPNQPISIYTLFGGTSAAASIVAGTISRMCTLAKRNFSPDEVWEILHDTKWPAAPDMRRIDPVAPSEGDDPLPFLNAKGAIKKAQR